VRTRTLTLAAAAGAALLATAVLPANASGAATPRSAQEGSVSAADLLAKVTSCSQISNGKYKTDDETSATIPVCGKNGAVFWKADMDIDCNGQITAKCNGDADPWFQDDTAFHQSEASRCAPSRSPTSSYRAPAASGSTPARASRPAAWSPSSTTTRSSTRSSATPPDQDHR
jgi:hypothetical protein